jgi:flavorubredoxin
VTTTYAAAPDIDVLTSNVPLPGLGLVPINAFVIKGREPMLVDTGTGVESAEFRRALASVIDPSDLRWLWLTHTDFDHIGSLHALLADNPRLTVITTFLGVGIMGLANPLPLDRVRFVNPGERVTLGDRHLVAVKPPVFDNPSTTGFYDERSASLFTSDCFGALLPSVPESAMDIPERDLRDGQVFWATVDAPWLHKVDRGRLAGELDSIRRMAPSRILSSHLPPAPTALLDRMISALAAAPDAQPFVGPDHAAFETMLGQMAAAPV